MSKQSSKKSRHTTKRVRFDLYAPGAKKVTLVGNFNRWDVNSLPMKRDRKGTWKASISLEPGRYEYRFWIDGVWYDDPNAQERVDNPFGSQNCVKIVG